VKFAAEELSLPTFVGSPRERAIGVAERFPDRISPTRGAPPPPDADGQRWIERSVEITAEVFPDEVTYLTATAEAVDTNLESLFARMYGGRSPSSQRSGAETDGCAVGASRTSDGSAWLVKNRDNRPDIHRRHIITRHRDPSWLGNEIIATSSAGGPTASSGGINTHGFCLASTGTYVSNPPPGIHRTLLIGGLLATCRTVDEALDIVGTVPHLGGTLTMADAKGAVATVELEPEAILVERASARPWVCRTNHCCSRSVPTVEVATPTHMEDSRARLHRMQRAMADVASAPTWPEIESTIIGHMTSHDGEDHLCRHEGELTTIATTLFSCDPPMVLTSDGPGCEGRWGRWVHTPAAP
jgi:hypothetical protein